MQDLCEDLAGLYTLAAQLNLSASFDNKLNGDDLATLAMLVDDVAGFQLTEGSPRWVAPYGSFSQPADGQTKVFISDLVDGMDAGTLQAALAAYGEVDNVSILSSADEQTLSRAGYCIPSSHGLTASVTFKDGDAASKLCAVGLVRVEACTGKATVAETQLTSGARGWSRLHLTASDEAKAKALWKALPAKLQLYFTSPLGGFDAVGFTFAVCRLSNASKEFLAHVSASGFDGAASEEIDRLYAGLHPLAQHLGQYLRPTATERLLPVHVKSAFTQLQHYEARLLQILNQTGATSAFEMRFATGSQHLWCRGYRPKRTFGARGPNQNTSRIQIL